MKHAHGGSYVITETGDKVLAEGPEESRKAFEAEKATDAERAIADETPAPARKGRARPAEVVEHHPV